MMNIIYILLWIVAILIILFLTYGLLRFVFNTNSFLSKNKLSKIASLGTVILLFKSSIISLLEVILNLFQSFIINAPENNASAKAYFASICEAPLKPSKCDNYFDLIEANISDFRFDTSIFAPMLVKLVLVLILWVILAQIIEYLLRPGTVDRIVSWLKEKGPRILNAKIVNGASFFLILVIGVYLSLAAIVTIPILQRKTEFLEGASKNSLEQDLDLELAQFFSQPLGEDIAAFSSHTS